MRWLGVCAFFAVALQGLLGGLRVTLLKDQIGIVHAALALSLLSGTILSLAMLRSDAFEPEMANADWTLDPIVSARDQAVIPNTIA